MEHNLKLYAVIAEQWDDGVLLKREIVAFRLELAHAQHVAESYRVKPPRGLRDYAFLVAALAPHPTIPDCLVLEGEQA